MTSLRTQPLRIRGPLCLALAAIVLAAASAPARAAPIDNASDHVAVRAFERYLKTTRSRLPASRRSDDAFVHSISARCANVLAPLASRPVSSVSAKAARTFVEETAYDVVLKANAPLRRPLARMGRTLSTLHWSDPRTTSTVGAFAAAEGKVLALATSDVCADARAFAANPHATPAGTRRWVANFLRKSNTASRAGFGLGEVLGVFHSRSDAGVLKDIGRLAKQLAGADKRLETGEETSLLGALGLHS
jgi:hypothetical protein